MLKIAEGIPDLLNDEVIKAKLNSLKDLEKDFFAKVFTKAKEKGEIDHADMSHVSELYLESLMGLTTMCVMETGKDIFPDKKALNRMSQKQKDLSIIFTKGLRCE